MANHNATVTYVEPNYVFSGLTAVAPDGNQYDRAPDLEDYCIAMNIGVEVSSREDGLRRQEAENRVLILSYRDNGTTSTVNFMSGTKLGGYKRDNNGNIGPNIPGTYNAMTTGPMDMYVTDLVDYGTTEMIGIKSVNIDYNSGYIPQITIQFTDVRGMSLFQPKELNYDHSFNGIRGLSKGNIAQTFFQCFFDLPLPKFTIQIKGFYGKPVSYQMMCESFDSNFNSSTGDFDITAKFIGYGFSFMSDISFDALLAAPYSDYFGKEYWNSQVNAGRFVIPGKNGEPKNMPRLYDIREEFVSLFNEANSDFQSTQLTEEEKYHREERSNIKALQTDIKNWYERLYDLLEKKYGKDFVFLFKDGEGYNRLILLSNRKDIPEKNLGDIFNQFDDDFKKATKSLYSSIKTYNESAGSFYVIKNVEEDFSLYQVQRIFKKLYVDVNANEVIFNGFDPNCDLPRTETIKTIFPDNDNTRRVRKIYHDGVNQFIYGFVVELDYSMLEKKVASLDSDANMSDDEKEKREKRRAFNQSMFKKMKWYPTIENFTKIMMAHLETLMAMMHNVVTRAEGRTVEDLGMSLENCSDINTGEKPDKQFIPPFPRVTKLITDGDGITKREDAWIGEFGKPGGEIPEVDMINGLFNGISEIYNRERNVQAQLNENNRSITDVSEKICAVKLPTTPYDFYIEKDLYGLNEDVSTNIYSFIGKVCLRMFNVLAVNTFRYQYDNKWTTIADKLGTVEAMNFYELKKIKNTDIFTAISEGGTFVNADKIFEVITANTSGSEVEYPWGKEPLFTYNQGTDILWMDRYKSKNNEFIYPAQNYDFESIELSQKEVNDGVYPNEDKDIIISDISNPRTFLTKYLRSSEINAFFNFMIETDRDRFNAALGVASSSSSDEAYSDLCKNYIEPAVEYNADEISNVFVATDSGNGNDFSPSSFVYTFGEDYNQHTSLTYGIYKKEYRLTSDAIGKYANCNDNNEVGNTISLSEVFGTSCNNGIYSIDKNKTYFNHGERASFSAITSLDGNKAISSTQFDTIFFLNGITGINYANVASLFGKESFVYIPNIVALQIGGILSVMAYNIPNKTWNISDPITPSMLNDLKTIIPLPDTFEHILDTINEMNVLGKMYLIKYFMNWSDGNYKLFSKLKTVTKSGDFGNRDVCILMQDNEAVQIITKELLSIVVAIRGNVNSFKKLVPDTSAHYDEHGNYVEVSSNQKKSTTLTRTDCKVTKADAIAYLNAFLDKLRELNGLGDEKGQITQQAKSSSKTTDDMKMELYRYLKQIYDKWIPTTDFEDWEFETFFGKNTKSNAGHSFRFIDSYYNRIDNKLLINPKLLSDSMATALSYTDINVMMHNFLADVYAAHRCMLRCVQNFADLANKTDMENMFKPLPYNEMGSPNIHPDFVVVYTYEPSRNLNIENGEFKDDSFMLNDEMETPVAIRSRSTSDASKYFLIPAFGVSYGRQYQNYFKNVSINMSSPVQTQQSLIAKHSILRAARSEQSKTVTAQDLYDIYSTQSYTCNVEMMGCAWVQPMMYFVLLNIPMFRGSYMIMKVNHKITPGNMVTTFTGCRMANVGNRIIQDIFSDEDVNPTIGDYSENQKENYASVDNDCPYKVFPLITDSDFDVSASELEKAKTLMGYLMSNGASKAAAAGIVGNMYVESTYKGIEFNHTAVVRDSDGFAAGGLIMWNDRYYSLQCMLDNEYRKYGYKTYSSHISVGEATTKVAEKGAEYQCAFIVNSMKNNDSKKFKNLWNNIQNGTAGSAADEFCRVYENPNLSTAKLDTRIKKAKLYYDNYDNKLPKDKTDPKAKVELTNDNIHKLLFDAVQKSISSTKVSRALAYAHGADEKMPNKPLVIIQQDGKADLLAKVFDIILNTPEYYKHVKTLYWGCGGGNGAQTDNPQAVVVDAVLEANTNEQRVVVADMAGDTINDGTKNNYNFVLSEGQKPDNVVNRNLLMSLYKKFGGKVDKHYDQFKDEKLFKDINLTNCGTIMGNNGGNVESPGNIEKSANIVIDGWDVSKVVSWINANARDSYDGPCKTGSPRGNNGGCHGLCASYVEDAISKGGGPLATRMSCGGKGYATNLRYHGILEKNGFKMIENGDKLEKRGNSKLTPQAGDVCIIGYDANKDSTTKYHACLWNGSQWVSDFKQNYMNVYNGKDSGTYPYAIYRFHNGKGTLKS